MPNRPLCEVCSKPEATEADCRGMTYAAAGGSRADYDDMMRRAAEMCWADAYGSQHSPEDILEVLRATRRERDALRARLAALPVAELVAYGRAREAYVIPHIDSHALNTAWLALRGVIVARWREWEEKP